jgi:hypothetical protein
MGFLLILLIIIVVSFLILRNLCLDTVEKQPTRLELYLIGMITWVFLLGLVAWFFTPLYLIYDLLAMGSFEAFRPLMFIVIATAFAYRFNEALDGATVLHFLRESALFHPMRPHTMHVHEELEKKKIRDIHRETSDKPFPTTGKQKRLLTEKEIQQYRQEMTGAPNRPVRSRRYDEEITSLKSGATISLADGWKVYTFDHTLHDFYAEISRMQIDPNARVMQFKLNVSGATERALQDPMYVYHLKQELYHLFFVLHTDPWLAWYSEFFDRIVTICYGIEPDSFGHAQQYPFMKIDIASSELHQREGRFINAADLHKISELTFHNGKPLPGEFL